MECHCIRVQRFVKRQRERSSNASVNGGMLPHVGAGLVPALVSIYHSGHPQEMPLRISARLPPLTEKQDHRLATEDYRLKCYLGNASVNESSFYFLPLAQIGSPWHFCHYLTCPPPKKMPPRVIGGSAYNALRYFFRWRTREGN